MRYVKFTLSVIFCYYITVLFILTHPLWTNPLYRKSELDTWVEGWRDLSIMEDIWWLQSDEYQEYHPKYQEELL